MSRVDLLIQCNTSCPYDKNKADKLEAAGIPFTIVENKIFFLNNEELRVSSDDIDEHEFVLNMLSDMPQYYLGGDHEKFDDNIRNVLNGVFGEIQLDINCTDSHSGDSDWVDFRINKEMEIEYYFENDDEDFI